MDDVICTRSPHYQEMRNAIMRTMPNSLHRIPDQFNSQEICIKAVAVDPSLLQFALDHFKTQEISDNALRDVFFFAVYP